MFCEPGESPQTLKMEVLAAWLTTEWQPHHPNQQFLTLLTDDFCTDDDVLKRFAPEVGLSGGFHYAGYAPLDCPVVSTIDHHSDRGELTQRTGAFLLRFKDAAGEALHIPVLSAHYADNGWYIVAVACIPASFLPAWTDFSNECQRLKYALQPEGQVVIIGGRTDSFKPVVEWSEIILPGTLKQEILEDVSSFFERGIEVYTRLNLKPFRKLLLAGVPGTGKTMLCSALAKWALERHYLVIYVSSAQRRQGDEHGSKFEKIQDALEIARSSVLPTIILLEELDAYLHDEEKALVLNVLDGAEAADNARGTLLIATTNYPEAIDERILKRPGRLDRIFIIPETRTPADAEGMLRRYLGMMWKDEHRQLVPALVGYPGAFIREVAIYALTQVAYTDMSELPFELLERSFMNLKEQLAARDEFITQRNGQPHAAENGA